VGARDDILGAIRSAAVPDREHPGVGGLGVGFDDLATAFVEAVTRVGGTCRRVADRAAADRALRELPISSEAARIVSLVPGVGQGNVDPFSIDDPHGLVGLDLCVLPARLGVAENGAVWIDGRQLPHQALVVVPEHLVIVLERNALVSDMHEAYVRLDIGTGYGVFLSGPSKTADIEQSLVIGAQGARSCLVSLVG
jgi:L-lactate dehydrogenase complex protein LldG